MTQDAFILAKRFRLSLDSPGGVIASDTEVLQRFLQDRNEEAFAQIMHRHGPLVWGLCRRALHNITDAEDAFQATFLALFQHADKIHKQSSLTSWLYGAAWRITHKIKRTRHRSQQRERELARPEEQTEENTWDHTIREVMDAELARLPAHYREPLLLCYLQGQSQALAAQTLGWPIGTVAGRLSRAKELLRSRLIRRGVAPAIAASLGVDLAQAQLPTELIEKTLQTIHAGGTSTLTLLAKGTVTTMLLTKWIMAGVIGVGLTLGAGWCYSAFQGQGESKTKTATESQPVHVSQRAEPNDYQLIQGQWRYENRHEVTDRLKWAEDLTFRGRKYATSQYGVDKDGNLGERGYESEALEFVLEPQQSPKRMELQQVDPKTAVRGQIQEGGERILCTYQLNGDTLTITYGGRVPFHVNPQGEYVPDRNNPQAAFPKPGDPNVRRQVYRRMNIPALKWEEVAHALILPAAIRTQIKPGDYVDIIATTPGTGGKNERNPDEMAKTMFHNMDRTLTGKLTKELFPDMWRARFDSVDANKDGFVDLEEFKAAREMLMTGRSDPASAQLSLKSFSLLEKIEVLAVDPWLNKDGSETGSARVLLRMLISQSSAIKKYQDTHKLDLVKRVLEPTPKKGVNDPNTADPTKSLRDTERKLLEEQVKACEDIVNLRTQAYKAGKETIDLLLDAIKKRTEVKLDLAGDNPAARQSALKEAVTSTKEIETLADAKYKADSAPLLELRTAQAERLNYELRLFRLEKK